MKKILAMVLITIVTLSACKNVPQKPAKKPTEASLYQYILNECYSLANTKDIDRLDIYKFNTKLEGTQWKTVVNGSFEIILDNKYCVFEIEFDGTNVIGSKIKK